MQVKGISSHPMFVKPSKSTKAEATPNSPKDKIEISSEARDLAKMELSSERLEEIRLKLSCGFYNSEEVLQKVAEKISKDVLK